MPPRIRCLGSTKSTQIWTRINAHRAATDLPKYIPNPIICGSGTNIPFGSLNGSYTTFGNLGGTEGTSIATTY
jgi:hypothetical protein